MNINPTIRSILTYVEQCRDIIITRGNIDARGDCIDFIFEGTPLKITYGLADNGVPTSFEMSVHYDCVLPNGNIAIETFASALFDELFVEVTGCDCLGVNIDYADGICINATNWA